MAAANIENFSVCRFVMLSILLQCRCRTFGKRCACAEMAENSAGFKRGNAKRCRDAGKRKGDFTQRRKDRKGAKAGQMLRARLCVFAIFAPLREIFFSDVYR